MRIRKAYRLPEELLERVDERAERTGSTATSIIEAALSHFLGSEDGQLTVAVQPESKQERLAIARDALEAAESSPPVATKTLEPPPDPAFRQGLIEQRVRELMDGTDLTEREALRRAEEEIE